LFAISGIEPDSPARKTRRIEITLRPDALEIQHGEQAVG